MAPVLLRAATARLREVVEHRYPASTRSRYSVERLFALKSFADNVPYLRVAVVGLASTVPSLLLIIFLDAIPLQDPHSGWATNISMWIRVFAGSFLLAVGNCFQLQLLAPDAQLDVWKIIGIGVLTGSGNCAASILLARSWVFPVPFLAILTLPVWVGFFSTGIVLAVGLLRLKQSLQLKTQLSRYATMVYIESNTLLIYSAYSIAFVSLEGWSQVAFVFVLPVIKYVLKRIMKRMVADLEDLVPALVTTIDLFNAMYQSKCMQGSGSALTTVGIIGIDLVQNVYAIQQLFGYMEEVEAVASDELRTDGALAYAFRLASDPNQLDADEIAALQKATTLKRILELLWRCERLLLVEYTESAIPLLYAVYLAVLYHLPNAKYYPGVADMDSAMLRSVISRILIYALLELFSLVFVHVVLMRRFQYSSLHQLAFTLKSECMILQGLLIAWVIVILQFTLTHYGIDFTFQFEWMSRKP